MGDLLLPAPPDALDSRGPETIDDWTDVLEDSDAGEVEPVRRGGRRESEGGGA